MRYRTLGKTGLRISEIGFGGWAIGGQSYGPTRDEESCDALGAAFDRGINFFDTADSYGEGHSEEILGRFLESRSREEVILATKVGWDFYHGGHRKVFQPDYIIFACEQSLRRLRVERIDLYQLHNPPFPGTEREAVLAVMERLKGEGKIRFIGVSVHREEEALFWLEDSRVDAIQLIFNLLDQRMASRVLPQAARCGVGIIAREPLASGLLTGKFKAGHEFAKNDHRRRWSREKFEGDLAKIERLKTGLGPGRVFGGRTALEFVLNFKEVSTAIPGAKTRAQVLEHIAASENPSLGPEEIAVLEKIYLEDEIFRKFLVPG